MSLYTNKRTKLFTVYQGFNFFDENNKQMYLSVYKDTYTFTTQYIFHAV